MSREEDLCLGCDNCLHCSHERKQIIYECDSCGEEGDMIYFDGQNELCLDCLVKRHGDDLMDYLRDNYILQQWAADSFEIRRGGDGSDQELY